MRLILFGTADQDTALLGLEEVRAHLRRVLVEGNGSGGAAPPRQAVDAGLFVLRSGRWEPGGRIVVPDASACEEAVSAGWACAEVLAGRVDRLRRAYEEAGALARPWTDVALLVVGGLLLDLFVGQALVDRGLVQAPRDSWRAWVLPPSPVSVGTRVRYEDGAGAGCGIMWVEGIPDDAELLGDEDLRRLASDEGAGALGATGLVRLRYLGWLDGTQPAFLGLGADDPLRRTLEGIAVDLVEHVHRPLLRHDGEAGDSHGILARSRMIFEHALARLREEDLLPPPEEAAVRRFVWHGEDWSLRSAVGTGEAIGAG